MTQADSFVGPWLCKVLAAHGASVLTSHGLLPDDEHARVPALAIGERTRLYTNGATHYTCYVRVGSPGPAVRGSPRS